MLCPNTAPEQQTLTFEHEMNIFQNAASPGEIHDESQNGTHLQEHLKKTLSTTRHFGKATQSLNWPQKESIQR